MSQEISAGGVVVFGNAVLLLRKYNGDYVLPKGKREKGESLQDTAEREVLEEAKVKARVLEYIDKIQYQFHHPRMKDERVHKTVHWYLMESKSIECSPQREEGFVEAIFVHWDKVAALARYEDEKRIIEKALQRYENRKNRPEGRLRM